ncbi:MAG: asparagine synthase (glutamine-hydrolyzing) [Propylenella sp.]
MCGIAGYFGSPDSNVPGRVLLRRMNDALRHRGPDADGVFCGEDVGLAHRRLSIIDLSAGAQPMANEDETIWISFNGEIFNYVELRDELSARGVRFRTSSDTEVIIRLYEEMGTNCVERLNGDFAFAIWDARQRRLMLARDRMGVRPLFYAWRRGTLYFASEAKALLQVPGIEAELDPVALDQIFALWFPLAPRTIFKGLLELPPAHVLIARADHAEVRRYWWLAFPDAADDRRGDRSEGEIVEEVRALLTDATRIRLRSDVPVGSYLSGGLDSSLVAAMARGFVSERLRTFSVRFDTPEFDETEFQMEMADALGTDHSAILCRPADIGAAFPDVVRHAERPILRTAPAPLELLSGLVREEGFKVVLTGEGADEVFGGYDIFKEAKLRRFCARQPLSAARPLLFRRLYPYLPQLQAQSAAYLKAFFATDLDAVGDPLFSHLPRFRSTAGTKLFFSGELKRTLAGYDALDDLRADLPADFSRWHPLSQAQYLETAYLLPGYILSAQGDRMAMANSVEGRFPFLDHRVVEAAARIPSRMKLRGLTEKYVLRQVARDLLPARLAERPKQPYRAPDSASFFGAAAPDYVARLLSGPAIAGAGLFDRGAVEKLAKKGRDGRINGFRDNAALVGILSTQLWREQFIRGAESRASLSQQAVA